MNEIEVIDKYKNSNNINEKNEIVMYFIGVIKYYVQFYCNKDKELVQFFDDLVNECIPGLIYALDKYNVTSGYRFSSFAAKPIKERINNFIRNNRSILSNGHYSEKLKKLEFVNNEILEFLVDKTSTSLDDKYIKKDIIIKVKKYIKNNLNERDSKIINLLYFNNNKEIITYRQISELLNNEMSYETIRQVDLKFIKNVKKYLLL
jgi:RNA polymerase sigma factor (sigma-70 family)